jgi:hypothetical protein
LKREPETPLAFRQLPTAMVADTDSRGVAKGEIRFEMQVYLLLSRIHREAQRKHVDNFGI